jgi:hypothetical protein
VLPFSYYTKRVHGARGDPRLAVLPPNLFKDRRVLDIGCNEGAVTIEIGVFLISVLPILIAEFSAYPWAHTRGY